nr:MAG TPA: hypothetical protein [Caudoviricetes sp.]
MTINIKNIKINNIVNLITFLDNYSVFRRKHNGNIIRQDS